MLDPLCTVVMVTLTCLWKLLFKLMHLLILILICTNTKGDLPEYRGLWQWSKLRQVPDHAAKWGKQTGCGQVVGESSALLYFCQHLHLAPSKNHTWLLNTEDGTLLCSWPGLGLEVSNFQEWSTFSLCPLCSRRLWSSPSQFLWEDDPGNPKVWLFCGF